MRYLVDHDYHIHSQISSCSSDPEQTPESILRYAKDNGLSRIVLTDHFWDEKVQGASNWYMPQNFAHISAARPLPQGENVRFYFGCETDMDKFLTLGISKERMEQMDFIIIPTTHLHMDNFTIDEKDMPGISRRRALWTERFMAVLSMNLPFHKIGIAHMTCSLMAPAAWEDHLAILDAIPDEEYKEVFTKAAQVGVGIELNFPYFRYTEEDLPRVLRPYRLAKECGCKFYFGSDAHHPADLDGIKKQFEAIVDALGLEESDKFHFENE